MQLYYSCLLFDFECFGQTLSKKNWHRAHLQDELCTTPYDMKLRFCESMISLFSNYQSKITENNIKSIAKSTVS